MIRHPKARFLKRPERPKEMCGKCNLNGRCKIADPWVYINESRTYGEHNPIVCANIRCVGGKKNAAQNLKNAIELDDLVTKKTPDGRVVQGTDASFRKRGFVDKAGNLYIYENHDWDADVVIPTGQRIEVPKTRRVKQS